MVNLAAVFSIGPFRDACCSGLTPSCAAGTPYNAAAQPPLPYRDRQHQLPLDRKQRDSVFPATRHGAAIGACYRLIPQAATR